MEERKEGQRACLEERKQGKGQWKNKIIHAKHFVRVSHIVRALEVTT